MKIILVCGNRHDIVSKIISAKYDIINKDNRLFLPEATDYLSAVNPTIDGIVIIDSIFSQWEEDEKTAFYRLADHISGQSQVKILVLTNDYKKQELLNNCTCASNISVITYDYSRLTDRVLFKALESISGVKHIPFPAKNTEIPKQVNTEKKKSFFDRFKSTNNTQEKYSPTDKLTHDFENISKTISRVISITGHRGSGLTSTSVNLAYAASKRGLKTIVIDMDIDYRGCNAYFSSFNEFSNKNEEINASLIRTLARPQDYKTTCLCINENFWLTSLGYSFNDRRLVEQFYTPTKLVGLLSMLRSKFNIIILDMPLDLYKVFEETIIHIDIFGLCVPNNIYSILSTLRNLEVALDRENISYLNSKSKVIVTKYNDRAKFQDDNFIPEKVCEVLTSGISDKFRREINSAGFVPYCGEFDYQIESDIPIVNSSAEYERYYGNILLRLVEGVK